jgi:hypothetical protein
VETLRAAIIYYSALKIPRCQSSADARGTLAIEDFDKARDRMAEWIDSLLEEVKSKQ